MSGGGDDYEDEDEEIEIDVEPENESRNDGLYVPSDPDEHRRQWALMLCCGYFAGSGYKDVLMAASLFDKFLCEGLLPPGVEPIWLKK